ncbi:MAG: tetratricopeptide repeat protein [Chitinophagaceae bacterium]|nr:tetratricopeptide repeat protein [Chitinophagaceae bacterium]
MAWFWTDYYWIGIILQVVFIIHAIRTGRGNWIWLLIFLPVIGSLIYFVMEVWPSLQHKTGLSDTGLFQSGVSIRELEKQVRLSDTFANRTQLAQGYAGRKDYDKAIEIYTASLTGMYADDLEVILQLARLHYLKEQYEKSIPYFQKALALSQGKFIRPDDECWFARALFLSGRIPEAESAFQNHIRFHKTFDGMYYYGELLQSQGRDEEALIQFQTILDQRDLLPAHQRKAYSKFITLAKSKLK